MKYLILTLAVAGCAQGGPITKDWTPEERQLARGLAAVGVMGANEIITAEDGYLDPNGPGGRAMSLGSRIGVDLLLALNALETGAGLASWSLGEPVRPVDGMPGGNSNLPPPPE